MTKSLNKITTLEAVCLVLILTVNRVILNMPQIIVKTTGSASIINIIYVSIIAILFTLFIVKLFEKFAGQDILDVSEIVGGKILRNILGILLIVYFILISGSSIRNFSEILYVIYYDRAPISFIILFFVVTALITNFIGDKSIIRSNVIITTVVIFSLFVMLMTVVPNFVPQRIYPILGYGTYTTFLSGITNIIAFNGLISLFCIRPIISEDPKEFKKIAMLSVILISILILFCTTSLLLSLSYNMEVDDISPVYTLITNNKFGNFIQHPESLFVFSWILAILSYLNIVTLLTIRTMKKITGINNPNLFIIPVCTIIYIVSLIPKNLYDIKNFEIALYKHMLLPLVFIIMPAILIIGNLKKRKS